MQPGFFCTWCCMSGGGRPPQSKRQGSHVVAKAYVTPLLGDNILVLASALASHHCTIRHLLHPLDRPLLPRLFFSDRSTFAHRPAKRKRVRFPSALLMTPSLDTGGIKPVGDRRGHLVSESRRRRGKKIDLPLLIPRSLVAPRSIKVHADYVTAGSCKFCITSLRCT